MRTIRISEEVWEEIARKAKSDESPDQVLRRVLNVSAEPEESASAAQSGSRQSADEAKKKGPARADGRQHRRKNVLFPAQVNRIGLEDSVPEEGIILDVSEGGLKILLPSSYHIEVKESSDNPTLSISIVSQRGFQQPITLQCVPRYIHRSKTATTLGVSFTNPDEVSFQILNK